MAKDLTQALENVESTYEEVVSIADEMIDGIIKPVDDLIDKIRDDADMMPIETIRDYILKLQLRSYELSVPKERSGLKANLAEALRKEKYANALIEAEGTAGVKDTKATLAASEEIVVEALYEMVSNALKTKLDEVHRLIDSLKTILMSRMQEAKFMNLSATEDPDLYRTVLPKNIETEGSMINGKFERLC